MLAQQKHEFTETNLPLSHGQDKNRQKGIFHTALKSDVRNSKLTDTAWQKYTPGFGVYLYHARNSPEVNKPSERFKPLPCQDQGFLEG